MAVLALLSLASLATAAVLPTTKPFPPQRPSPHGSTISAQAAPDPPSMIAESASEGELTFQPVLDYDMDSCYNVPAIDLDGNIAEGLPHEFVSNTEDCRDEADLDNQNVYSRAHCNNGWCAYLYEHYFEKDIAVEYFFGSGHRHEWENVVVVVKDGDDMPTYVAASAHGGYETRDAADVRFEGTHAKIVYHKDGASTHAFRFGREADENPVENHRGEWIRGALLGWENWPSTELRDQLIAGFDDIDPNLDDASFSDKLATAIGDRIPEFDTGV